MKEIVTERLIIRDYEKSDFGAFTSLFSHPEIIETMSMKVDSDLLKKMFDSNIEDMKSERRQAFHKIVLLKESMEPIGDIGLNRIYKIENGGMANIGFLFSPKYWGKGYATESAKEILKFGFLNLNLHKIFSTARDSNQRSKNLLKRVGMSNDGVLRKEEFVNGEWVDISLWSILRNEWTELQEQD